MKTSAVIILLAVAFGLMLPPAVPLVAGNGGTAAIGILDICHSAAPAISSSGEMPCISTSLCKHCPLMTITYTTSAKLSFSQSFFVLETEQPPKA